MTRERGATEPRRIHGLSSYFALEGDLVLTHGPEEVFAPEGSWVQVPAGHEHAVDGLFLNVTGAVVDNVNVSVRPSICSSSADQRMRIWSMTAPRSLTGARPSSQAGNQALANRFIGAFGTPLDQVRSATPSTRNVTLPLPQRDL